MEITLAELALFVWASITTLLWQQTRHEMKVHKVMTIELIKRIATGQIKVVEHEDSFELMEVKNAN